MLEQNQLSFFFDHSGESSTNAAPDIGGLGRLDGNATTNVVGVDSASATEAIGLADRQHGTQQGTAPRAPKVRKPRTPRASSPCPASPAAENTVQVATCPPPTVHAIVSSTSTDLESAESVCALIDTWEDLSDKTRTDYKAAIRKVFEILIMAAVSTARPASLTCETLNAALWARPPIAYGIKSKGTFNNFASRIRRVMIRLGRHAPDIPLTNEWLSLFHRLPSRKLETNNGVVSKRDCEDGDDHEEEALDPTDVDEGRDTTSSERRKNLVTLLRYCSSHSIAPAAVTQASFDAFCLWRQTRTIKRDIPRLNRITASNWEWARENIPGWPQGHISHPGMQRHYVLPLTDFLPSFQADVNLFIRRREEDPRETMFSSGRIYASNTRQTPRSAPRKAAARTIDGLRRNIAAAATALVLSGIEIARIRSLQDLVSLPNAEIIVRFHLARRQAAEKGATYESRPSGLIAAIEMLRQVAKFHCNLPSDHIAEFSHWKVSVVGDHQTGMSAKNRARLRALLDEKVRIAFLKLPWHLMRRARLLWADACDAAGRQVPPPKEAIRITMHAVALEFILFCPLRRSNLVGLDLDRHLLRSPRTGRVTEVLIQGERVKNRKLYNWPLADSVGAIIAEWERDYRPHITRPTNRYLFPGLGDRHRDACEFGNALGERVEHELGVEYNMHIARHFAVVSHLRRNPGDYGTVSRLLGHSSIEVTIAFYAGLEIDAAGQRVNQGIELERAANAAAEREPMRPRRGRKPKLPVGSRRHRAASAPSFSET